MNNDDIKKIVSETVSNPDVMSFLVKQIQDQIEKEQSKVEQNKTPETETKIDNHTKDKVDDIKSKADNYTSNNEHVNRYISERDKYMDVFKKVTEKVNQKDDKKEISNEKEITQEPSKKIWTQNTSQVSIMHNFSDGWYKWYQETTDGKVIGNIFFDLVRGNNNNFDTFLNIYSILNLYADEWDNWEVDHYDWKIPNHPISKLIDSYTYEFTREESKIIDSMEDTVYSYTHVEIDNELPMVSIYIIDYSKKTNKIYDFNRIIFTPSDDASEEDIKSFYFHLFNSLKDESNVRYVLEDYCYTFINKYIIHGVGIMPKTDEEYYKMMNLYLMFLLEEKKKESMKVETVEIKATDTPDKTNSILDKLGIPHDKDGNVEIPISSDFISNRTGVMNKHSDSNIIEEEEPDNPFDGYYYFIKGKDNQDIKQFLINVINDGFIKVDVFSPEHIHLNINGTNVFLENPYASNPNRDIWGNKKH